MKGETDYGKGSAKRSVNQKRWDNSVLWLNIEKAKLLASTQEVIKITPKDER